MTSRAVKTAPVVDENPQSYEETHVHKVYDEIAAHFSSTRYKPWPIIAQFLSDLPTGWVGIDSGCGNGKYLPLPTGRPGALWTVGLDRSRNLLQIARNAGEVIREVIWGDVLDHCWREGAFDYAISIATIHHLATSERRKLAIQRLLQAVSKTHGRVLVYVWAVEQDELSKRAIPSTATADGQDVFIPWVLSKADIEEPQVLNRYYHMFSHGELGRIASEAAAELGLHIGPANDWSPGTGVEIVQAGWERSNYFVELRRW
ncbi:S-adenosyl-L-methionine-dependent methyltransferase [Mycena floridula]|nr:S-adenosyl-L-methionine-dependent methyltransferase [Mycena floridula]